jgi:hypothetical protein
MLGFVKMSVLSAILSFATVTAYNHAVSPAEALPTGKTYQDRIPADSDISTTGSVQSLRKPVEAPSATEAAQGKGDRHPSAGAGDCAQQAWPNVALACMSRDDGYSKPNRVRVITVESRGGPNTSVLERVSQTDLARR